VTLWHGVNPPSNRDVLQELVKQFNDRHPDICVEALYVGQQGEQTPKILASIVGDAPPDLLWYNPTIAARLVELDAIRPLDDFLADSPLRKEIDPNLFDSMQFQGHIWSVPFGTNNAGIYYRPSLLAAAGITQLPQTWEELRQVARKLTQDTDGDGRVDQYGILLPLGKGDWTVFMWLPFLWSGGGELVDTQSATGVDLVNEGAIAALQFWRDLIEDGSAVLSAPERGYELDRFLQRKVAMQFSGPWTLGQLQATGVDFGVMPMPSAVQRATIIGGENLFVFKTTPSREKAALTFAEFVESEEFQTQWAMGTGYLPVNLKARQSEAYRAFIKRQPAVKVFLEQVQYGHTRPILLGYRRISENLGRAIEAVLLGKSSPQAALENAQRRLNLIFRN
jgi:multiple sugar transport system substrate-binding protein